MSVCSTRHERGLILFLVACARRGEVGCGRPAQSPARAPRGQEEEERAARKTLRLILPTEAWPWLVEAAGV